jgi:hypothetical protein
MLNIPELLLGAILLLLGRRLFFLFVAGIGFIAGASLVLALPQVIPQSYSLYVGVALGLLGALLSVYLHRYAVIFAGFLAGSYLCMSIFKIVGINLASFNWIAFIAGGIIGALLLRYVFNWSLIFISTIIGALFIVQNMSINRPFQALLFVSLLLIGIVIQAGIKKRE